MRSITLVRATSAVLLVTFGLLLFGAYLLITQGKALVEARENLETARAELHDTRLRTAAARADRLYLEDAVYGTNDFLQVIRTICAGEPANADMRTFCQYQGDYMDFLDQFMPAVLARTSSQESKDYDHVASRYAEFAQWLNARPADDTKRPWLARAHEGIAYARLKQGALAEAQSRIEQARSLDRNSGFVALTWLKLSCARHQPAEAVRRDLQAARQDLDSHIARVKAYAVVNKLALRNVTLERALLDKDEELYQMCDYAGLDRKPPPTT